ncbi:MAG: hypothetical protein ACFFCZ_12255 [Promethearchaeota archaeon]
MREKKNTQKQSFYLISVDVIQGFLLFIMMFGHGIHWWNKSILYIWDTEAYIFSSVSSFGVFIITFFGNIGFPLFLFLYTFNTTNSLIRKDKISNRSKLRLRLINKSIIFAMFGFILQFLTAITIAPSNILNFLLSWHVFHMFAFSGIYLLFIFELSWWLEEKAHIGAYLNHRLRLLILLTISLIVVLVIFLIFHDYSSTEEVALFPNLDLLDIFRFAFFDDGRYPVIPWLSFSLIGGIVASFLDLAHTERSTVGKRSILVVWTGILFLIPGFFFLNIEGFDQSHTFYRGTSSFVLITIGMLCLIPIVMLRLLDFKSIYSEKKVNKFLYPFVLISNITFTVYIVHNVFFILDSSFVTSEIILYLIFIPYWFLFVIIAYIWRKWDYKYSFEWMIRKFQNFEWRRNLA